MGRGLVGKEGSVAHLEVICGRLQLADDVIVDVTRRALPPVRCPVTVEIIAWRGTQN